MGSPTCLSRASALCSSDSPSAPSRLSRLTTGRLRMLRARLAYLRVLQVSSRLSSAPLTHAICMEDGKHGFYSANLLVNVPHLVTMLPS